MTGRAGHEDTKGTKPFDFVPWCLGDLVSAGDADAALHETFNFEWDAVGFCLANELGIDLEDAQFDQLFHG